MNLLSVCSFDRVVCFVLVFVVVVGCGDVCLVALLSCCVVGWYVCCVCWCWVCTVLVVSCVSCSFHCESLWFLSSGDLVICSCVMVATIVGRFLLVSFWRLVICLVRTGGILFWGFLGQCCWYVLPVSRGYYLVIPGWRLLPFGMFCIELVLVLAVPGVVWLGQVGRIFCQYQFCCIFRWVVWLYLWRATI